MYHGKARARAPPSTFSDGECQLKVVNESAKACAKSAIVLPLISIIVRPNMLHTAHGTNRRSTDKDDRLAACVMGSGFSVSHSSCIRSQLRTAFPFCWRTGVNTLRRLPCAMNVEEKSSMSSVGLRGQIHMSDRSRQSVAGCWGVC